MADRNEKVRRRMVRPAGSGEDRRRATRGSRNEDVVDGSTGSVGKELVRGASARRGY